MSTLQENLNAIKLDKDTNLKPENLKAGITCLGVTGTLTQGEDLQEQLDNQDLIIQQLQEELAGKSSGEVKPNIFLQLNEPEIKEGIWIQAEGKTFNKIIPDNKVTIGEDWDDTNYTNIPYSNTGGRAVSIGTDIYLFGGSTEYRNAYKYDTLTNTYTALPEIGFSKYMYGSGIDFVGDDLYIFGYDKKAYKFNIVSNTFTQLQSTPKYFQYGRAVAVGTDIYLFGGHPQISGMTDIYNYTYKYNTLTGTYTQLTDIPYSFKTGGTVYIHPYIYLFGSTYSEDIYNKAYKYDIENNTYSQLSDIPRKFYSSDAVAINTDKIYLVGGGGTQLMTVLNLKSKEYENNSIVISQAKDTYKTQIFNNNLIEGRMLYSFDDVWHNTTENGLDKTLPTYYGNGTEWVKFKN